MEHIAPLFVKSLDTSLPGVVFSTEPIYALDLVISRFQTRLFPPKARKTYVLELSTGALAGFASVKANENGGGAMKGEELDLLFVSTEMGGRGYGGLLMRAMQEDWKEGMFLNVFQKNSRAICFYEKFGFELVAGKERVETLPLSSGSVDEVVLFMRWQGGA